MVSIKTWRTDITNEQSFVYIKCKQYDTYSRKYRMIITDKGLPQSLNSSEHTVYIRMWKKGDFSPYVNKPLDWEDGFPVVEFKGSMLSKDGVIDVDFAIHSNITNSIVSTRIQHIEVQKSLLNYDGLMDSEEFDILSHLINQVNEVPYFIEKSKQELNELVYEINVDIRNYETSYTNLQNNINTWFSNTKSSYDSWYNSTKEIYDTWFELTKDNYDTWYLETKQNFDKWFADTKSAYDKWFSEIETAYNQWFVATKDEYVEWFEGAKFEYALSLETSQADYVEWVKKVKDEYNTWYEGVVSIYETTQSNIDTWFENTQTNYNAWYDSTVSDYNTWYDNTTSDYNTWFENTSDSYITWYNNTVLDYDNWYTDTKNVYNTWYNGAKTESDELISNINLNIEGYQTEYSSLKTDITTLKNDVSDWYETAQADENTRIEAENTRALAESTRESNEKQRQENTATAISDCELATANANNAAENANTTISDINTEFNSIQNDYNIWYAETKENYNTWYSTAQDAEVSRINAEDQRSLSEQQRSEAESQREINEESRQTNYSAMIANCENAIKNANDAADNAMAFINDYKSIELGNFVNMVESSENGIYLTTENNYIASSESTIAVPYYGCKFYIQCNEDYNVKIRFGKTHNELTVDSGWLKNGEFYTVSDDDVKNTYFRVYVTHVDNTETETTIVDASTICEIANVKISYESAHDIVKENTKASRKTALKRSTFYANTSSASPYKYPVIIHITDTHGDTVRVQNAVKYAEGICADYIFVSGDIVSYRPANGYSSIINTLSKSKVPVIIAIGNHDVYKLEQTLDSDINVCNNMISYLSEKFGYEHDDNAITYTYDGTLSSYYYVDNDKYMLRIISINEYEKLGASEIGWIKHMNQPQVDFIINAMVTAPDGYSILFVYHEPDEVPVGYMDEVKNIFYQQNQAWTSGAISADFEKSIINTIVDSFNNKELLNTTISQANTYLDTSNYTESVSLIADFSSITSKFVGHVTGHWHTDCVMNMPNTVTNQLLLNLTSTTVHCGNTWGYAELSDGSDLPRIPTDETQDSFNTYIIDTDNSKVHIVRVGSDETFYDDEPYAYRDYLSINYGA